MNKDNTHANTGTLHNFLFYWHRNLAHFVNSLLQSHRLNDANFRATKEYVNCILNADTKVLAFIIILYCSWLLHLVSYGFVRLLFQRSLFGSHCCHHIRSIVLSLSIRLSLFVFSGFISMRVCFNVYFVNSTILNSLCFCSTEFTKITKTNSIYSVEMKKIY